MPKISVVVIMKELDSKINETLTSLLSQNFEDYDIILVCHKNLLQTLPTTNVPMKIIEQPETSRGAARNIGVENSSGEVIAFIDDDCVVNNEWLMNGVRALCENERIGVVGGTVKPHRALPEFSQLSLNIISIPLINGWSVTFSNFPNKREVSYVPTCNAFFKKEALKKVGGFRDTNYCEDVEVCSRIRGLGYKIVYDSKVEVEHKWKIWNWRSFMRHFYNYGKGRGRAMREYPHIGKTNLSPLIVFLLMLIAIPLVILEPLLLLFIAASFAAFALFCSIYAYYKFKKIKYFLFTPLVMVSMYLSYTLGMLRGVVSWKTK